MQMPVRKVIGKQPVAHRLSEAIGCAIAPEDRKCIAAFPLLHLLLWTLAAADVQMHLAAVGVDWGTRAPATQGRKKRAQNPDLEILDPGPK